MPEKETQTDNATPPAASGGITLEQLNAALQAGIADAVKPLQATIADLQGKLNTLHEGLNDAPKGLTVQDVKQLVADDAAAARASADAAAKKAGARQAVITGKLAGVPEEFLAKLPDSDDPAELDKAADAIVARWNEVGAIKPPDLGGAAGDGGTIPGQGSGPAATNSPLPDGLAKYAASIKLPDAGAAQPAAAK